MNERKFLGKTIAKFSRKPKPYCTAIPTYPADFFQPPIPHTKPNQTDTQSSVDCSQSRHTLPEFSPQKIPENFDMLNVDDDVTLTQEREKYIILFMAQDETDAQEKYALISRSSGTGSTSPTHHLQKDFVVSLQEEAIMIRGSLQTLRDATEHLHALEYISVEKRDALLEQIDAISDRESDTESSGQISSETDDESDGKKLSY